MNNDNSIRRTTTITKPHRQRTLEQRRAAAIAYAAALEVLG